MKAGEAEDRWDTGSGDTGRLRPEEGRGWPCPAGQKAEPQG